MAGKMNSTLLTMVVVVVVAMTMSTVMTTEARVDLSSILEDIDIDEASELTTNYQKKGAGCCNNCGCLKYRIPQCQCIDVKPYCHSQCRSCSCTKSIPPQCTCKDVDSFCYPRCTPNDGPAAAFIDGIAN